MINIQSSLQKPKVTRLLNAIRRAFDQTAIKAHDDTELNQAYGFIGHKDPPKPHVRKQFDRSYGGVEILENDSRTVSGGPVEVYKLIGDSPVGMWGCFQNSQDRFRYIGNTTFPGLDVRNCTVMGNLENSKNRITFAENINIVFSPNQSISFNPKEAFHAPMGFFFHGLERVN